MEEKNNPLPGKPENDNRRVPLPWEIEAEKAAGENPPAIDLELEREIAQKFKAIEENAAPLSAADQKQLEFLLKSLGPQPPSPPQTILPVEENLPAFQVATKFESINSREVEKRSREQQKEQARRAREEEIFQTRLATLGLVAKPGQPLTPEQKAKIEALRKLPPPKSNLALYLTIGGLIGVIVLVAFLAILLIPPEVSLGDLKAPDNSARYDLNPDVAENARKITIPSLQLDEKRAKKVTLEMVAASNQQNPNQVMDYFNSLMKEKSFPAGKPLDPILSQTLALRGLGAGVRPTAWQKSPADPIYAVLAYPLAGNPAGAGAISKQLQGAPNLPAVGSFILMVKAFIPPQ